VCPSPESLIQQMVVVLKEVLEDPNNVGPVQEAMAENSWDLREEVVRHSYAVAACQLMWIPEKKTWNDAYADRLLNAIQPDTNNKILPGIWKQVEGFCDSNNIDKGLKEYLWSKFYSSGWMQAPKK